MANEHTIEHQVIRGPDGAPLYAVVLWSDFEALLAGDRPDEAIFIPHEVVELMYLGEGMSLIRAWREHLGLTQAEVASRMHVSQPAYAKCEQQGVHPRVATLRKIAAAMGVEWEQLRA